MQKIIIGVVVLVLAAAGFWYWQSQSRGVFTVDSRDTIENWDFPGSHKDGGELEQRVYDEIARMEEQLGGDQSGTEEATDYSLYVGIAGQYSLIGDGENSFKYLNDALAVDAEKTGLAWHNMGVLMERLEALNSAKVAYQHAVDAQPHIDQYHIAFINFLIKYYSEDKDAVTTALSRAEVQFNDDTFVWQARAEWLEGQGDYHNAINVWTQIRDSLPAELQSSVDQKIRQLEAKL